MIFSNFNSLDFLEKTIVVAFWSALAMLVLIASVLIITKKFKPEQLKNTSEKARFLAVGYVLAIGIILLTLTIDQMITDGEIVALVFYPVMTVLGVSVAVCLASVIIKVVCPDRLKVFKYVSFGIIGASIVACIVCLAIYFPTIEEYYEGVSQAGLYISAVILVATVIAVALVFGKKDNFSNAKSLAYSAVCIALAYALSYVKIFRLPQGGSITAVSMLPLIFYSYMFGTKKGVITGAIYGVLQAMQDPWIIHPAQFLLDYPIAFAGIGLSGLFREVGVFKDKHVVSLVLGGILGGTFRYLAHAMSGTFAFASYAPEEFNAVAWGFLYNTYALVDVAMCLVVGGLMLIPKSFRNVILTANVIKSKPKTTDSTKEKQ